MKQKHRAWSKLSPQPAQRRKIHLKALTGFCLLIGFALVILGNAQQRREASDGPQTSAQVTNYHISGPYSHRNLAIFLIHGKSIVEGSSFLTLQEALAQKKVIVYETKDVNELAIRNLSDRDVYVQSGDIVRGGEQDRMISVDFIVPPNSGRMPIAAFCVESGRWSRRGNEAAASFSSSENSVTSKEIKLAAKRSNSQGAVWENVTVAQDKLSRNVGGAVNSTVSVSSLELALENSSVKESAEGYIKALSRVLKGRSDAIGYVFAINGQLNSADVYSSSALFAQLWPKLLKASAVEAIAELQTDEKFELVKEETVQAFLREAEIGDASEKDVTDRVRLITREDPKNIFFETRDRKQKAAWIHRNYIRK